MTPLHLALVLGLAIAVDSQTVDMYTVRGAGVGQVNGFYVRHQDQKRGMEVNL
jgi:hypothetical protein